MNTPGPIPSSVRALLPLCGAENDHEALGACRGVGRKLQAAGLDWHDLAAAIPASETLHNVQGSGSSWRRDNPVGANRIRPFDTYARKRVYTSRQESEHRSRVRYCQSRPWRFSARERAFLADIARLHGNLTIHQGDWLALLTDRLDQELRTAC
ncbi:hypothetical protein [Methylobacterium longum]|uniref:Transposase n=1 Tax=Methylobacterium longum TaxID=767694 RepID=A0ABT8AT21_9HYPH|nr:hypothetical protein [Methylobacterium longum]MDN3572944.1 hypothetical protein [Methylobacterium longum]GJE14572.1 hypothetical protein FOHLNKBM_5647 [Methylobacterium longum]